MKLALTKELPVKWVLMVCFAFAFLLYGNTLKNQYCLDDSLVILKNSFTKSGFRGIKDIFVNESFTGFFNERKDLVSGGRYRPLSIATFAVEYGIFKGLNPKASHFVNIILYALTIFLIFLLVKRIFYSHTQYNQLLAIVTAMLFMFHPVHTEVIANIKGRDEIMALLFSLWATWCMYLFISKKQRKHLLFGSFLWFLALLSKENAAVFIILMPLLLYLPAKQKIKPLFLPVASFLLVGLLYYSIRNSVLGNVNSVPLAELMNNSYLGATNSDKMATVFFVSGKYLKLLLFPFTLTHDYYPYHINIVSWTNIYAVMSLILYVLLFFCGMYFFRGNYLFSVSIAIYIVPLIPVSNVFFPVGTFMGERFIYFSSLGFCLAMAALFIKFFKQTGYILWGVFLCVVILFGIKTIQRNNVWYNDYTLFTTDVKTSVNSAKINCAAGGIIMESADTITNPINKRELMARSKVYLRKAIGIHPVYSDAWLLLGNWYFRNAQYDSALYCYTTILRNFPNHSHAVQNTLSIGNNLKDATLRIAVYDSLLKYQANNYQANYQLGLIYGKEMGDMGNAAIYLEKAYKLNPQANDVILDLGVVYGFMGNYEKSVDIFEKALLRDTLNPSIYTNLGISYQKLGMPEKAKINFEKAQKLRNTR